MRPSSLLPLLTTTTVLAQGTGRATFYGGNTQGGTCSFSTYTLPSNLYGTALSGANWDSSANCGRCASVTGPAGQGPITVMVVDKCPECPSNGLDLFQDAFEQVGEVSEGIIQVEWEWTECGINEPLQVHLKSGVSAHWFSAQVVGANKGVADMQVSTDGGSTWQGGLSRMDYNFFENSSGYGTESVAIRAVSVDGEEVVVQDVAVTSDNVVTASGNF